MEQEKKWKNKSLPNLGEYKYITTESKANIEEYKHLYQEIHSNEDKITRAIQIMVGFTGLIIGYGMKEDIIMKSEKSMTLEPLIFLVPLIIIIPFAYFISAKIDSTKRIATYIQVFHESDSNGPKWETRFNKFKKFKNPDYGFSLLLIFASISTICFVTTIMLSTNWTFLWDILNNSKHILHGFLVGVALWIPIKVSFILIGALNYLRGKFGKTMILLFSLLISFLEVFTMLYIFQKKKKEVDSDNIQLIESINQLEIYSVIIVLLFGILILSLHKIYWVENKVENKYLQSWKDIRYEKIQ